MPWLYSETRWRISKRCPREYYCHYYLSRGGFASDAPQKARLAHLLKNLQSVEQYAVKLARAALTELLLNHPYGEEEFQLEKFSNIASRHLRIAECSMIPERYLQDHAVNAIDEIYYQPENRKAIFKNLQQNISSIVNGLTVDKNFARLKHAHGFYETESPSSIMLSDICCYFDPVGILSSATGLYFLDFATPEAYSKTALLHKYYAHSHFRAVPARVFSVFIDRKDGHCTLFNNDTLNVTDELNTLCNRAFEIADQMPSELIDDVLELPGVPRSICARCRFREICRT